MASIQTPYTIHLYINRMQIVYDDDDLYFCDQFSFVKSNMYRTKRHEHKRKVYHLKLSKIVKWKIKFWNWKTRISNVQTSSTEKKTESVV